MDSNNFFTPVKNLYTQMKGNINFPQTNSNNKTSNNKKTNNAVDDDLYDNIHKTNNYEENKQINKNKSKSTKSNHNNEYDQNSLKPMRNKQDNINDKNQKQITDDSNNDYVPLQTKSKTRNTNNSGNTNGNNSNSYNFNNQNFINKNLFEEEGINYNTYDDNSYKNGSTFYTNSNKNNSSTSTTHFNGNGNYKNKPLPTPSFNNKNNDMNSINNNNNNHNSNYYNNNLGYSNSVTLNDYNYNDTDDNYANNGDVFDDLSLGDSNSSVKSNISSKKGDHKKNNSNDSLLDEKLFSEFSDFVEIKDKNVSPICGQYYIPFYQSSEMCSNEARKWLEERWFLPANFKDIQWSSPSRFYFPVYVFSMTTTVFYVATFTVNDFSNTTPQQKLTSSHEEVVFCASTSFDSSLVDQLVKEGSYSNRSTHLLPPIEELLKYSPNQTRLPEKVLSVDISKEEITEKFVKPYIEKLEKKKCLKEVQEKNGVKNVDLQINKLLIDSEEYSIVFLPINSLTYQYGDKLYETLTSGKKSKTVGFRPIGTGSVGGAIYDMVSKVSTTVKESI
ncbi:hypothetical protein DICPUDRAFT_94001 [Dictyostelium purpureum]|uniref:Uncharacterized protein n=1 Tax=Dictyostelium purpureum TaxID=5786 RepID=F0ZE41_DICPU|nr:uncharacterized protein DICPUDRAFT_94001 [Dictyostelium purpureum]EGC37759.1 hypothetical protein DICPUDRAFT_94001 [Dictyostelium purpureum]|eukprot:XP_003285698.1 hypothetical protein DICPUDRAFT_94001 [Dictyostelium purpureum]